MNKIIFITGILFTFLCLSCEDQGNITGNETNTTEDTTQLTSDTDTDAAENNQTKVIVKENEKYGKYLADRSGRPLYIFLADTAGKSTCYNQCAEAWPPLTGKTPIAGEQVQKPLLGTIQRDNGKSQITYNNFPLYYYYKDKQEGQFAGQDLKDFGAEWYLISPEGEIVHAEDHKEETES